jgi:hypothetical protein
MQKPLAKIQRRLDYLLGEFGLTGTSTHGAGRWQESSESAGVKVSESIIDASFETAIEREEERRRQATEKWLEMTALPDHDFSREYVLDVSLFDSFQSQTPDESPIWRQQRK